MSWSLGVTAIREALLDVTRLGTDVTLPHRSC